jgi:NAD(P)-dependent dehydrogenase (short-subunit alcohol dehydrogenase family)
MKKNLFENEAATFEDWDAVYRTNVSQCYFMTTAFLPLLQKATEKSHGWSGTVINISSMSGIVKTSQHHPQYDILISDVLDRSLTGSLADTTPPKPPRFI